MSLAVVYSRAQQGIHAPLVYVEVHLSSGLPSLSIVGLPEAAVKESKDRVRAALINTNFDFPIRRITVNLAPADLPKEGGRFDLPIALGILAASGQIPKDQLSEFEFVGELALSGDLRPVSGVFPVALHTSRERRNLVVPRENANEAALVQNSKVYPARDLLQVCAHLSGTSKLQLHTVEQGTVTHKSDMDLADVRGQQRAKRALQVTAAGAHNMLMIGPPGTGKTMLASRLPTILPTMSEQEAMQTAAIHSICGYAFHSRDWQRRPFRSPHHTASGVALVGGGSNPRPGEISLAHNGVLFLDEVTEFDRRVLEVLREPMETGRINISRAARQVEYPARFQLIAAMNPCPQGYACDLQDYCQCTPDQQRRHRAKISAPLLDRIDLHVDVPQVPKDVLRNTSHRMQASSTQVREHVIAARDRQLRRQGKVNAHLTSTEVERFCVLSATGHGLIDQAMTKFRLSARAYHRILKLARTIADLANTRDILPEHVSEAISYRALDRLMSQ